MPIRDLHICVRADSEIQAARMIKNSTAEPTEAEVLRDLVTERVSAALNKSGQGTFKRHGHGSLGFGIGGYTITSIFAVQDFGRAENVVREVIDTPAFAGKVDTYHWFEDREEMSEPTLMKSIEIYYDIADIPSDFSDAFDFRNKAMGIIETALSDADAGEWAGAESGSGEVNFGFDVENFERAEKIVRAAVKGTEFANIREITRFDPDNVATLT